jgi:RsiW-degrading membrane proteinase PrsW (M82 family)
VDKEALTLKVCVWRKSSAIAAWVLAFSILVSIGDLALAQDGSLLPDQELAETYAPVLYFHPDELFRPQTVGVLVDTARLRQVRPWRPNINVLPEVSVADLLGYSSESYNLDSWLGDEGASDYKNFSAHRTYYELFLSPQAGGPPVVAYAHVVRDEAPLVVTIQYWLFYYYNDWFNKHEGDWEMVQVVLGAGSDPEWVVLSQHHGGTRRPWSEAKIEEATHPVVYVALGSHANYFRGDEDYANTTKLGSARIEIMDRTGRGERTIPEVILVPDRGEAEMNRAAWPGFEWLLFGGGWGEDAPQADFSGPKGPADKGAQWEQPYAWGAAQPLDTSTWYGNRLRVEVLGEPGATAQIVLRTSANNLLESAELLPGLALLHADPGAGETILAEIDAAPDRAYDILATWPQAQASQVIRYHFDDVPLGGSGRASLSLGSNEPPTLLVAEFSDLLGPSRTEVMSVTWDAPDLVWAIGVLPATEVVSGITLSLFAGLLPILFYVGLLYWADRYEKEPAGLLAAAFLWGAIPAVLFAVAVRLFFQLPASMVGPGAVEALQTGLVMPLVEETLKGTAVLWIAWRHRLEFDNVLDGIIYGAMAGFGFAMTGNTLSYLGSFLQYGFGGLGTRIYVEGVLYGLNQALYAAIFGAAVGYARLAQKRWQRWAVPIIGFVLAVGTHALHNLALRLTLGWNPLALAVTWAGGITLFIVMFWSLRRQRHCLATELVGEVPEALLRTLIRPRHRICAQIRAFFRHGLRGLARLRHTYQQCAELAFKKMQHRRRPDEPGLLEEIVRLRRELEGLLDGT